MSWSDPELIKKMEAEAPARPQDATLAASLDRIVKMAASDDPGDALRGKLMLACVPLLHEWSEHIKAHDIQKATDGAVAIVDAFAGLLGNVMAAVHPVIRPRLKSRFDESLAATLRGIEGMLEKARRS